MLIKAFLILILTICYGHVVLGFPAKDVGCSIDVNKDLTYQHPLILEPDTNKFILPNIKNGITFSAGKKIRLSCPGNSNHLSVSSAQEVTATCVSNKTFTVSNNIGNKPFKELRCVTYPDPISKKTGQKCSVKYTEIQIGFDTKLGFIPLITTCLDDTKKDSLYSWYQLSKQIKNQQYSVPRPNNFQEGNYYSDLNPRPSSIYEKKSQRVAFERILGSAQLAQKYVSLQTDFFLSRGHLTAKADFVYGSQQRATFFYVNVAPQWHTLNSNNWNELEMSVRNFAGKRKLDLVVYTGIYGNSQLPDINNTPQDLSLFVNSNRKAITVPEIFWKVVHDPLGKTGTVFVGHNNPYEPKPKPLCTDVSSKISWVSWDAKNVTAGISYCCDFNEFKRIVDYMPDLPIHDLLI